jgi:hypothetical protein
VKVWTMNLVVFTSVSDRPHFADFDTQVLASVYRASIELRYREELAFRSFSLAAFAFESVNRTLPSSLQTVSLHLTTLFATKSH